MPRYEYGERFWTIEIQGKSFTTTYGKIGTPGRSQEFVMASPADAKGVAEERIRDKTSHGYKLVKPASTKGAANELPAELAESVVWEGERIHMLHLSVDDVDGDLVGLLDAALAVPAAARIAELELVYGDDLDPNELARVLAKRRPPLTKLTLGAGNDEIGRDELGDISGFWPVLPTLQRLLVRGSQFELGDIVLPQLRGARFATYALTGASAHAIGKATWPKLELLDVYTGDSHAGADCTAADLAPLLARRDLSKLIGLAILNSELANELAGLLPDAPILRRLSRLSLAHGTLDDDGARVLANHKAALAHLAVINVHDNFITDPDILHGCAKSVFSLGQKARPSTERPRVTFTVWKPDEPED